MFRATSFFLNCNYFTQARGYLTLPPRQDNYSEREFVTIYCSLWEINKAACEAQQKSKNPSRSLTERPAWEAWQVLLVCPCNCHKRQTAYLHPSHQVPIFLSSTHNGLQEVTMLLGTCKGSHPFPFKVWSLASRTCNRMLFQLLHILASCWNCRNLINPINNSRDGWYNYSRDSILFSSFFLRCFESKSNTNMKHPKFLETATSELWFLTTGAGKPPGRGLLARTAQLENGKIS